MTTKKRVLWLGPTGAGWTWVSPIFEYMVVLLVCVEGHPRPLERRACCVLFFFDRRFG